MSGDPHVSGQETRSNTQVGPKRRASLVHIQGIKSKIGQWEQTTKGHSTQYTGSRNLSGAAHDEKENKGRNPSSGPPSDGWKPTGGLQKKTSISAPQDAVSSKAAALQECPQSSLTSTVLLASGECLSKMGPSPAANLDSLQSRAQTADRGDAEGGKVLEQEGHFQTPKRAGGAGRELVPVSKAHLKLSSRKAIQPNTPRGNTPAAAKEPSTASKLWSILKTGAKLGFSNKATHPGRAGEATLMTALNLTEALAAEGTKVAQPSSRGGSTAREPAVHSKGNCPDDGVLETEKQELPCSDAADRQAERQRTAEADTQLGRSLAFSPSATVHPWSQGDAVPGGTPHVKDLDTGKHFALASPQLSIPGTPTDYTAFSAGTQDTVVLCNNNGVFSPVIDETTAREANASIMPRLSLGGDCHSDDTVSLERRFNLLQQSPSGRRSRRASQASSVEAGAVELKDRALLEDGAFTFPALSTQHDSDSEKTVTGRAHCQGWADNHRKAETAQEKLEGSQTSSPRKRLRSPQRLRPKNLPLSPTKTYSPRAPLAEIQSPSTADAQSGQAARQVAHSSAILHPDTVAEGPFDLELETAARRAHLLLSDACSTDKSPEPGSGHLSCSDEESQPIENTIQLAWRPSFADEYKRLFATMDVEDTLLKAADQGGADEGIGGSPDTVALIAAHAQNLGLSKAQCTDLLKVVAPVIEGLERRAKEGDDERQEVLALMENYKEALSHERSEKSQAQSRDSLLISELQMDLKKAQRDYAEQQQQFKVLHREKYLPLKETAALLNSQLTQSLQEASKLRKAADEVAQLRSALREAQMHSKRDLVKSQALTEEVEQLEQELEAAKNEAEINLTQRQAIQAQAEAALAAAEGEKREAWQAIDRVTAELDRARERAHRAEHRLSSVATPSRPRDLNSELLKEKDEEAHRLKMQVIDLKSELRKCCNSCMEAQSRCVELEEEVRAKASERDKLLQICDQLLTDAEKNRKAVAAS